MDAGLPLTLGPGALFRTPRLADRLELMAGVDVWTSLMPTFGERCEIFGDSYYHHSERSCSDESYLAGGIDVHVEAGARVWLTPHFAAHASFNANTYTHVDGEGHKMYWLSSTRLNLIIATKHLELIGGGALRFALGQLSPIGRSGVSAEFLVALRVNIGGTPFLPGAFTPIAKTSDH